MKYGDKEVCILADIRSQDALIAIYKSKGYILVGTCPIENEIIQLFFIKNSKYDEDIMIAASRKFDITKQDLIDTLTEKGIVGVYNLGLKNMLNYLNGN